MKSLVVITILSTMIASNISSASIVSFSGNINQISTPISVMSGSLESDTNAQVFLEQQNYLLGSELMVDQLSTSGLSGSVSSGNNIDSYFIHFDPVGDQGAVNGVVDPAIIVNIFGTLTFDTEILGLIWGSTTCDGCPTPSNYLDTSDSQLATAGVLYPTGVAGRGLETDIFFADRGTQDFLSISGDFLSLSIDFSTIPKNTDQLRVITTTASPVPLPASIWLFITGLLLLMNRINKNA